MAGSAADTPTTPDSLRASDAERDQAIDELRQEFIEGRLSQDTFMLRMESALGSRHRGQLADLFTDLPPRRPTLLARLRETLRSRGVLGNKLQQETWQIAWPAAATPGPSGRQRLIGAMPLAFPPGGGTTFTIGRNHDCDLRISDMSVSRLHASLARVPGGWLLTDLGSRNGTRLNGWRIREPVSVHPGDRVEFGSVAFVLAADPWQPPPA
jgi:FHA domain/Domain of unknown function (DUF1707)